MDRMRIIYFFVSCMSLNFAQDTISIFSYNLLNYQNNDTSRDQYFRTIIGSLTPDIIVTQENTSASGTAQFKSNIIDNIYPSTFSSATFIDGTDSDNMLYYRTTKFSFLSNTPITTALRDINEFKLVHTATSETLRIYSVHLKASSGSSNEALRAAEVDSLRQVTDALHSGTNFIVCGDFNIYGSTESAYQKLLEVKSGKEGEFYDAITMSGTWNNSSYAQYHTQSPRVRSFGGGATGGLDDRFDLILYSKAVKDTGGVYIIQSSITPYGNDGNHYNDSINAQPNTAVSTDVADALHYASDHLPVYAKLVFSSSILPVELTYFGGTRRNNSITLLWSTATEVDNYGFEIERRTDRTEWRNIGFVQGSGTSNTPHRYSFTDIPTSLELTYYYRLKQIDNSGGFEYHNQIEVNISSSLRFNLNQNYPNPGNPVTTISFSIPQSSQVKLSVIDISGKQVDILVDDRKESGSYFMKYDGSGLSSGTYFIRLEAGEYSETKKMILLR